MSDQLVRREPGGVQLTSFDTLMRFAEMISKSPFAPTGMKGNADSCAVAIQYGAEIGLTPVQSIQSIYIVDGKPMLQSDAMLAVVRGSGLLEDIEERVEGTGAEMRATCTVRRKGAKRAHSVTFSIKDATRAGLMGKQNWKSYPERMLTHRARAFAMRDEFSDILKGVVILEEFDHVADAPATKSERLADLLAPAEPMPYVDTSFEAAIASVPRVEDYDRETAEPEAVADADLPDDERYLDGDELRDLEADLASVSKTLDAFLRYVDVARAVDLQVRHANVARTIIREARERHAEAERTKP